MKKILIVMTSLYNGGAERSLVNFLTELPANQYQVDLLLFKKNGMFLAQVPEYVNILETPASLHRMYGPLKKAGLSLPRKLLGNAIATVATKNSRHKRGVRWKYFYSAGIDKLPGRYDLAVAYISGEVLYYVDEKVNADQKMVWIHNDYVSAGHPRDIDYPHLKKMDRIVTISNQCADILKKEFPEFSDRIRVLENLTSQTLIRMRAEEFIPEEYDRNGLNILSIGRLYEQKGFDLAIQAARHMKNHGCDFRWFVIGSGPEEKMLRKQLEKEGLEDTFILLGPRENPYPYIRHCSLFVQPSRYEGKSVVLDEAKILAVPILATSYPTVGDQLKNHCEGYITSMNPEKMAEDILWHLEHKEVMDTYHLYLSSHDYGNAQHIQDYEMLFSES